MSTWIVTGDVFDALRKLPDASVDCVVTSPPYWGLRDYKTPGQIGLERTLAEHIGVIVAVFREVRRVLKPTGTVWLNYGDCYATSPNGRSAKDTKAAGNDNRTFRDKPFSTIGGTLKPKDLVMMSNRIAIALQDDGWLVRSEIIWNKPNPMPESTRDRPGCQHEKIWFLAKSTSTTIWRARDSREWSQTPDRSERLPWPSTKNPDRTRPRWEAFDYFYDQDAVKVPASPNTHARISQRVAAQKGSTRQPGRDGRPMHAVIGKQDGHGRRHAGFNDRYFKTGKTSRMNVDRVPEPRKGLPVPAGWDTAAGQHGTIHKTGRGQKSQPPGSGVRANDSYLDAVSAEVVLERNLRNVWTIAPKGFREAHFATFPPALVEPCIKAGCPVGGTVLDPFGGAGTVGLVAAGLGRRAILIELNSEYTEMARRRIADQFGARSVAVSSLIRGYVAKEAAE